MPSDPPIRSPDAIRGSCAAKIDQVRISEHFGAMLGCLLGEDWTTPRIVEMVSTSDDHLLGRCEGDPTCRLFLGETEDLLRNIHGVAEVAGLDGDEIGFLVAKVAEIKRQK
jgi:hypothetical protein